MKASVKVMRFFSILLGMMIILLIPGNAIGEMVQAVVDLQGTPPFDFEWQRSEAIWDHSQKRYFKGIVLETHTVHNVEDHRYYINTSKEGVIEVRKDSIRLFKICFNENLPHVGC